MTTIQIYSNNFSGQTGFLIFYPQTGGTINIGTVTLPYNYSTDYYYGTYIINFSGFSRTCNLNILAPSSTPTNTPTVTPTQTIPPNCDVIVDFVTPTPSITPTMTVTPTITLTPTITSTPANTPTPTPTPNPLTGCNCYQAISINANGVLRYVNCSGVTQISGMTSNIPYSVCVSGTSITATTTSPNITSVTYLGQCSGNSCTNTYSLPPSDPILLRLTSDSYKLYGWDVSQNKYVWLNVPNMLTGNTAISVAHTSNKIWVSRAFSGNVLTNSIELIREWDITLSPFTATFSKDITVPRNVKIGLFAINDTTLLASSGTTNATTATNFIEIDVTNPTPVITEVLSTSPLRIGPDYVITNSNKLITIVSDNSSNYYVQQYDYPTKSFELSLLITGIPSGPITPITYNNNLYLKGFNTLWYISNTNPYLPIINQNKPSFLTIDSSQIKSYLNTQFII